MIQLSYIALIQDKDERRNRRMSRRRIIIFSPNGHDSYLQVVKSGKRVWRLPPGERSIDMQQRHAIMMAEAAQAIWV